MEIAWGQAISGRADCNVPILRASEFVRISLSFDPRRLIIIDRGPRVAVTW